MPAVRRKSARPIYFVTVIPKDGESRCWGWFRTLKAARAAVAENRSGMDECYYRYLVIERCGPGVPAQAKIVEWYRVSYRGKRRWVPCDQPKARAHIINYAIG